MKLEHVSHEILTVLYSEGKDLEKDSEGFWRFTGKPSCWWFNSIWKSLHNSGG